MIGLFSRRRRLLRDIARATGIPLSRRHYDLEDRPATSRRTLAEHLEHLSDDRLQEISATAIGLARRIAWLSGGLDAFSVGRFCLKQGIVALEDVEHPFLQGVVSDHTSSADQFLFGDGPDFANSIGIPLDQSFGQPDREAFEPKQSEVEVGVDPVAAPGTAPSVCSFDHPGTSPTSVNESIWDFVRRGPFQVSPNPDGSVTLRSSPTSNRSTEEAAA